MHIAETTRAAKRFIIASLLITVGFASAKDPSTTMIMTMAEMLTGHEISGATAAERQDGSRVFLWEMGRPGVLSPCTLLRMEEAVASEALDRDTAVLFLADLVDGTDSLAECDAAAVEEAEGLLESLGLDLPERGELSAQSAFNADDVDGLLNEAQGHSGEAAERL